jgi:hypothetical protein
MRRQNYTLIEMLMVMVVAMVMMQLSYQFFHDAFTLCRNAVWHVHSVQETTLVANRLRGFVHDRSDWRMEGRVLVSGWRKIVAEGNTVVFHDGPNQRVHVLDSGLQAKVFLEPGNGSSRDLAVIEIEMPGKKRTVSRTRIVACCGLTPTETAHETE